VTALRMRDGALLKRRFSVHAETAIVVAMLLA
jgi:hypothetical protein